MRRIRPSPSMRARLQRALGDRLAELPGVIADPPDRDAFPDAQAEEALRRLSVPLRRLLMSRSLSAEGQLQLPALLAIVSSRATWEDVRFLDAFNVLYESWGNDYLPGLRKDFLALYRSVLTRAVAAS